MKLITRILLALGAVDAHLDVSATDDRQNVYDIAGDLIGLSENDALRLWCNRASAVLEHIMTSDTDCVQAILVAQRAVLRFRASIPAPPKKEPRQQEIKKVVKIPEPTAGSAKKILEFVRAHPEVRNHELMAHFATTLSRRTIQRSIKELVRGGSLERMKQQGVVLYRPTS